jgi:cytoskeletal protein RodZ
VAKKKKRKKTRSTKTLLLFIVTPLLIWAVAFLLWLYWYDRKPAFNNPQSNPTSPRNSATPEQSSPSRSRAGNNHTKEKISDEDRKKLEEILENR